MTINILSPNGTTRSIEISPQMEAHFAIPINHANTILDQINSGMYQKWFKDKKDMVVLDFGSNVGLVSLYMLPAVKKLMAVEPTPSHYDLLSELLWDNLTPQQNVMLSSSALTAKEEDVVFATGHATENKITSPEGYGNNKITVTGKPLSWFLNEIGETVDFCKIDVEGGEIFALTEEEVKLAYGKVKVFFVECHPTNNYGMDACREELVSRFTKAGYQIEIIDYQTFVAYES